jgi:MoaE-MoaD fusion protein
MMRVKVLFFAIFRDLAGAKETHLELSPQANVSELRARLLQEYPDFGKALDSALISVNREFAFDEDIIPEESEIAIFPPVSGGQPPDLPTICEISGDEIDINDLLKRITLPTTGAVCSFTGIVRAETTRGQPHQTQYLEYEAYEKMARDKLLQIAAEIRGRWSTIEGVALIQRIGRFEAGSVTVVIACSAAHRDTGVFEAAHYGIDRLKEIVPVWKKEITPQAESWVEGNYKPNHDDRNSLYKLS